jgi:hypothetical protein
MSGYSEDDLAGLTDEERAALNEDDGSGDSTTLDDSLKNEAGAGEANKSGGDDGKGQQADKGAAGGEAAGSDDGKGATDADKGAATDAGGGGGADDGKQSDAAAGDGARAADPIVPLLIADAPADAEAKFKEIGDKKGALLEQFDNGDITAKEYQSQLDELNRSERALERAIDKAQTAAEMKQQQEVNAWLKQVNDFTNNEHPEYKQSRSRWMALDSFVKEIAQANPNMDGGEILRQAHAKVIEDIGEAPKAANPGGKQDDTGKKLNDKSGQPLKGAKIEPPQTLGKIPASDNADINDGKYAALDRLADTDPLALEEKLMRMSAADRDEYLASRG